MEYINLMLSAQTQCSSLQDRACVVLKSKMYLLRSFISWKAFFMCVWLNVCIPPFAVSSSGSAEQFGRGEAGAATRLVRHERQCLDGKIDGEITISSSLWMVGCGNDSGLW